jgi:hypothetical protein
MLSFGNVEVEGVLLTATKAFEGSKIEDPLELEMVEAVGRNYLKDNTNQRADIHGFHLDEDDYLSIKTTSFVMRNDEIIDGQRTVSWSVVGPYPNRDFLYLAIHSGYVNGNPNIENEKDRAIVRKFQEDIAKIDANKAIMEQIEFMIQNYSKRNYACCYLRNDNGILFQVYKHYSLYEFFKHEKIRSKYMYYVGDVKFWCDEKIQPLDDIPTHRITSNSPYAQFFYESFLNVTSKVYDRKEINFMHFVRYFLCHMGVFNEGADILSNYCIISDYSIDQAISEIPNAYSHLKNGLLKILQDKREATS